MCFEHSYWILVHVSFVVDVVIVVVGVEEGARDLHCWHWSSWSSLSCYCHCVDDGDDNLPEKLGRRERVRPREVSDDGAVVIVVAGVETQRGQKHSTQIVHFSGSKEDSSYDTQHNVTPRR